MLSNPADMAITRAIIALGHTLGLKIVAEGVEDLATAQVLGVLDCEELQGYYFSRPLPVDQLETWARQHRALQNGSLRWMEPSNTQPAPLVG
ncbi:Oxygen sensor protein DosP [compost metagenome]